MFNTFILTQIGLKPIKRNAKSLLVFVAFFVFAQALVSWLFFELIAYLLNVPIVQIISEPMFTALYAFGFLIGTFPTYWGLCYAYNPKTTSWLVAGFTAAYLMVQNYPVVTLLTFAFVVFTAYAMFNFYCGIVLRLNKAYIGVFKKTAVSTLLFVAVSFTLYIGYCASIVEAQCLPSDAPDLPSYPSQPKPTLLNKFFKWAFEPSTISSVEAYEQINNLNNQSAQHLDKACAEMQEKATQKLMEGDLEGARAYQISTTHCNQTKAYIYEHIKAINRPMLATLHHDQTTLLNAAAQGIKGAAHEATIDMAKRAAHGAASAAMNTPKQLTT